MSFFVWRKDHEDLKQQLAAREAEIRHLLDLMWKQGFGVQLFGTIPANQPEMTSQTATPDLESAATPEEEMEIENQREMEQLSVVRRTSPGRLASMMERMMSKKAARLARAAHPNHKPGAKVAELFEQARKEVS